MRERGSTIIIHSNNGYHSLANEDSTAGEHCQLVDQSLHCEQMVSDYLQQPIAHLSAARSVSHIECTHIHNAPSCHSGRPLTVQLE